MNIKNIAFLFLLSFLLTNCTKTERETVPLNVEINDFVWKGMNTYYLWQNEVPDLADDRFTSQENLYSFLEEYDQPADLFSDLKYNDNIDKWSWIVDDYVALENYFSGVRTSTGAIIKLYLTSENSSNVYGIVRYIVPNSDAASKPIQRGAVFNSVNGALLNTSNYSDLLYNSESYTLNLGSYFYNATTELVEISLTGNDVTLNKGVFSENPIHKLTTFEVGGNKVGYLMYNSFISNYNQELNNAFLYLKNENVSDLILDLRYNGGGSVQTATYLAGMITGQFNTQLFTEEKWNDKWQIWLEENHPDWMENHFTNTMNDGSSLNNLNLSRVIVLTTENTASASELIINGLSPYIDVVTIGSTTHGKYVASVTLYDSPNFSRENVNIDHNWALQPIVLKEVNKLGAYAPDGFEPSILIYEEFDNMGILGSATEPMTARALNYIMTGNRIGRQKCLIPYMTRKQLKQKNRLETEMFINKSLPFEHI